jgi:ABC-type branched-subunit amino acid transport system ATPase component
MNAALETSHLTKRFGGLIAANDINFRIERGARHALIGPNGAGKTTFINLLTGALTPSSGSVILDGKDITKLRAEHRVRGGLVRTFQINQLFPAMTPLEALTLAANEHYGLGTKAWRGLTLSRHVLLDVGGIAEQFGLSGVLNQRTSTLAYGKQRLLEIALAFACRPRVLLLDEPAAGVPEEEREEILSAVAGLPRDVSVLLIEHDMDLVFRFADRISVLASGALLMEGSAAEVANDQRVRAIYLGSDADE